MSVTHDKSVPDYFTPAQVGYVVDIPDLEIGTQGKVSLAVAKTRLKTACRIRSENIQMQNAITAAWKWRIKTMCQAVLSVRGEPIRLKRTAGNVGEIADLREKALGAFLDKLQLQEGENLLRVVLFGSVARGDSRPDSDIDLFVLVKEGTRMELTERIVDIATDINLEEGDCKIYISPYTENLKDYKEMRKIGISLFYNIDEEGVVFYDVEK